jgi:glycosyltransferase involved in cell wall biosynthesis
MRIFHIVEEISFRNQSIVSLVNIISKYRKLKGSKIISPFIQSNILRRKNIIKQSYLNSIFFYHSKIYNFLRKTKPDIIHFHGLWKLFHIIFFINAKILNIKIIIQPHGMLLDEAIKSKNFFNYLLKLFVLSFYSFFSKNINFIAVTNEEKISIKKFFKKSNIEVIENPFFSTHQPSKKINKQFVYFGRISRHKNLKLIIESYHKANLSSEWKLLIYGIEDDKNYKNEILKFIKKNNLQNKVYFKNPIFNKKKKFEIISQSYQNILMSKSEILSLSVLESLSVGTMSIVNSKINYPKYINNFLIKTKAETLTLSNKIKYLSKNFYKNNFLQRKKISTKFKKIYFKENDTKKNYISNLYKIKKKKNAIKTSIFSIGVLNLLNNFFVPFLITIYAFTKEPVTAAEIGIAGGTVIFIFQIFSMNARAIILSIKSNSIRSIKEYLNIRILLGVCIILLSQIFLNMYNFENIKIMMLIIIIISLSWVNEINFTFLEKENSYFLIKIFTFIKILIYSCISLSIILNNNVEIILIIYCLVNLLILLYLTNWKINFFNIKNYFHYFKKNTLSFFSTSSSSFAIIFWRYSILYFTTKEQAGIIFAVFSIASMPGTILNNILGQTILRDQNLDKKLKLLEKKYFRDQVLLIILFLYLILSVYLPDIIPKNLDQSLVFIFIPSFLGTFIMIRSIRLRHQLMVNKNYVFKKDILYSIFITPLIIILNYIGEIEFIIHAFLISSVTSFLIYKYAYSKKIKYS